MYAIRSYYVLDGLLDDTFNVLDLDAVVEYLLREYNDQGAAFTKAVTASGTYP